MAPMDDSFEWNPSAGAVSVRTLGDSCDNRRPVIIAQHPTAPYVYRLGAEEKPTEDLMRTIAGHYLVALDEWQGGLGLHRGWLALLGPDSVPNERFGWCRLSPDFGEYTLDEGPLCRSKRLLRRYGDNMAMTTVIMVAGEFLFDGKTTIASGFGVRVVADIVEGADPRVEIRSMTAHLPHEPYLATVDVSDNWLSEMVDNDVEISIASLFNNFREHAFPYIQVGEGEPASLDSVRLLDVNKTGGLPFEITTRTRRNRTGSEQPTTWRTIWHTHFSAERPRIVQDAPLVSDMQNARLFAEDPSSWRDPSDRPYGWYERQPVAPGLDAYRTARPVPVSPDDLVSPDGDFEVRNCPRFVPGDGSADEPKQLTYLGRGWPRVRSDDHSAASAYANSLDAFDVMRGFGIRPELYFRGATRPVAVFYRSGIEPGPGKDGNTINARVKLQQPDKDILLRSPDGMLEVHLALADLTHRDRDLTKPPKERYAQPLGIATAERWMMHEFGHVLIAASLGELELRFAHSVGDALAAIWADPLSTLADPRTVLEASGTPVARWYRGMTYPFVTLTRRHDRSVQNGWSWTGTIQRPVNDSDEITADTLKGYLSEQILSTTLFRLYRILGGDTTLPGKNAPDVPRRLMASRLVTYLVMRALESFCHVPLRAEELEEAMIAADTGLSVPLVPDPDAAPPHEWVGGRGHKVIRWAFEAQGMHAPEAVDNNRPGDPPEFDIYILDRRPTLEVTEEAPVAHGPGNYLPVSLDWVGADGQPPKWHMAEGLRLGNRGQSEATDILLRVWFATYTGSRTDDGWDREENITWHGTVASDDLADLSPDAESGGPAKAGIDLGALAASVGFDVSAADALAFLEITCRDDRASSDPTAPLGLPTAIPDHIDPPKRPRELADLVANDNNLGVTFL